MDKVIKCLLLDVDNVIISQVEEVGADTVSYTHLTLPTILRV